MGKPDGKYHFKTVNLLEQNITQENRCRFEEGIILTQGKISDSCGCGDLT